MIKVLLVDDEFLVCSYLRQIIDWEAHGCRIVGQAGNGRQAVERIRELEPDLVFLDVNMPEMDGIDLIHYLHNEYPAINVVILSSYSDYHYVRETMKFGARDYLLKHELKAEDLVRLLGQFGAATHTPGAAIHSPGAAVHSPGAAVHAPGAATHIPGAESGSSAVPREENSYHLLRDRQVRSFFESGTGDIPESLKSLRKPLAAAAKLNLLVSPAEINSGLWEESYLVRRILNTCEEICSQNGETKVVFLGDVRLVFLFSALPAEEAAEQEGRADQCMGIIQDVLLKYYNIYADWHRGSRLGDIAELPGAYRQLLDKPLKQSAAPSFRITIEQELQLIAAVSSRDKGAVEPILKTIFLHRAGRELLKGEFSILIGELLSLTMKLYQENNIPFPDTEQDGISDMKHAYAYFQRLFTGLIETGCGKFEFSWAVTAVIEYVRQHYKEDISITDIGAHCGMNSSYLGTLFKRETGIGLIQYINRVRVHAAGTLMLIQKTAPTQVYERVGFRNYNNFFNLFKETTGLTPKQFREEAASDWASRFHPLKQIPSKTSPGNIS